MKVFGLVCEVWKPLKQNQETDEGRNGMDASLSECKQSWL